MHAEKNSSSSSSSSSSGSKKNSSWLCITQCEVHLTNQQSPDRKGGMFIETYWNQSSSFRRKIHKSDWLLATYLNVNSSRLYIYIYNIYSQSTNCKQGKKSCCTAVGDSWKAWDFAAEMFHEESGAHDWKRATQCYQTTPARKQLDFFATVCHHLARRIPARRRQSRQKVRDMILYV